MKLKLGVPEALQIKCATQQHVRVVHGEEGPTRPEHHNLKSNGCVAVDGEEPPDQHVEGEYYGGVAHGPVLDLVELSRPTGVEIRLELVGV